MPLTPAISSSSSRRPLSGDRRNTRLVLYSDAVNTDGCGSATSAVGPFYCPADQRVYLGLSFYEEMADQLAAPGDFAWAYVIAHEMGHHVQEETGMSEEVERLSRENPHDANELSVRLELQADCYAGVWGNTVFQQGDLQGGDLEEAFTATEAIGDDGLQKQATGHIDPDSFTHGTSEQRRTWFTTGYRSGARPPATRLGRPALSLQASGRGVRANRLQRQLSASSSARLGALVRRPTGGAEGLLQQPPQRAGGF